MTVPPTAAETSMMVLRFQLVGRVEGAELEVSAVVVLEDVERTTGSGVDGTEPIASVAAMDPSKNSLRDGLVLTMRWNVSLRPSSEHQLFQVTGIYGRARKRRLYGRAAT